LNGAWLHDGPKMHYLLGGGYNWYFLGPAGEKRKSSRKAGRDFNPEPIPWNRRYLRRVIHYLLDHCAFTSRKVTKVEVAFRNGEPVVLERTRNDTTHAVRPFGIFAARGGNLPIAKLLRREGRLAREERERTRRERSARPMEITDITRDGGGSCRPASGTAKAGVRGEVVRLSKDGAREVFRSGPYLVTPEELELYGFKPPGYAEKVRERERAKREGGESVPFKCVRDENGEPLPWREVQRICLEMGYYPNCPEDEDAGVREP
jgi:hypothetical protein